MTNTQKITRGITKSKVSSKQNEVEMLPHFLSASVLPPSFLSFLPSFLSSFYHPHSFVLQQLSVSLDILLLEDGDSEVFNLYSTQHLVKAQYVC